MSIKVVSGIAGSVTAIGGSLGIYLFNNSKKTPNLTKNSTEQVEKKEQQKQYKKVRNWSDITDSQEYKSAKLTGKLLNHISYLEDEMADNDANYFLMNINSKTTFSKSQFKEINISVSGRSYLEITFNKSLSELPIYCFKNNNSFSSIEDLNFNDLKNCDVNEEIKYMVVFLNEYEGTDNLSDAQNQFNEWHNKNSEVEIELIASDNERIKFKGKMLKIFHKGYEPNIT